MTPSPELTICTVSYNSSLYLKINKAFVDCLNPNVSYQWTVCENSPKDLVYSLSLDDPDFQVIKGPPPEKILTAEQASASYHHAAGLNRLLHQVDTRYALILDPDFFIVRPGWIQEVLAHMKQKKLSFFGAPWHPKYITKYRYFPCVHCMFIDVEAVGKKHLDFTPYFQEYLQLGKKDKHSPEGVIKRMPWYIRPILPLITKNDEIRTNLYVNSRRRIGSSPDTGYRIYKQFLHHPKHHHECIQPAFQPLREMSICKKRTNQRLERWLPDELRFKPEKRHYYSTRYFKHKGCPDLRGDYGWDEFLWNNEPYGFHIRNYLRTTKKNVTLEDQVRLLLSVLPSFAPEFRAPDLHKMPAEELCQVQMSNLITSVTN